MVGRYFYMKILPENFHAQQHKAYLLNLRKKSYRKFNMLF